MMEYRALRDLEIPLVNVSANPSEQTPYIWQGILQGPVDTVYEGLVIKFEILIPESYPYTRPKVILHSKVHINHPLIMNDGELCLDVFRHKKDRTTGWNTLYSIYSILHQLQGFFYEGDAEFSKPHRLKKRRLIRESIFQIRDDLVEYDKNKRILLERAKIESQKAIQSQVDEATGLKLLLAQKKKEEEETEKKREKQRVKRRERRAVDREKSNKENLARIAKIKADIKEKELSARRELRERMRQEMALEKNMKIEAGEGNYSES
jgi:ubiquitin-protein ligase